MNTAEQSTFNQAVYMANIGQKNQAYNTFSKIEAINPNDVEVLLWLAYTAPSLDISKEIIKRAKLVSPNNPMISQSENWFASQKPELKHQVSNFSTKAENINNSSYNYLTGDQKINTKKVWSVLSQLCAIGVLVGLFLPWTKTKLFGGEYFVDAVGISYDSTRSSNSGQQFSFTPNSSSIIIISITVIILILLEVGTRTNMPKVFEIIIAVVAIIGAIFFGILIYSGNQSVNSYFGIQTLGEGPFTCLIASILLMIFTIVTASIEKK